MLENLTKITDAAKEKITRLGADNNSFEDYMQAVGAEFELIGITLLIILCILLIIAIPIALSFLASYIIKVFYKKMFTKQYFVLESKYSDNKYGFPIYQLESEYPERVLEAIYKISLTLDFLEDKKIFIFTNQKECLEKLKLLTLNEKNRADVFSAGRKVLNLLDKYEIEKEYEELSKNIYKFEDKIIITKAVAIVAIVALWILALIPLGYILLN